MKALIDILSASFYAVLIAAWTVLVLILPLLVALALMRLGG